MIDSRSSVAELLAAGAAVLDHHGIADPRREVERLWRYLDRETMSAAWNSPSETTGFDRARRFLSAVERRAAGEPLEHVTGWCGFRRLTLRSDRRALIPRPETEGLVAAALARVRAGVAADIGTGTGAIALSLRGEGAFDEVIAVDTSPDALALAALNADDTGLAITLVEGDLVTPLAGRKVDLLVSNPPYLTAAEYDTLDAAVRDYEPMLALAAGPDGLSVTRRLLDEGRAVMRADGWIALEIDCRRASESAEIATGFGWQDVIVLDDLFGRARYLLARQGSSS